LKKSTGKIWAAKEALEYELLLKLILI